jgi:hypothetical protein
MYVFKASGVSIADRPKAIINQFFDIKRAINNLFSLPFGLEDSSTYPVLFAALLEDTTEFVWTEEDLGKVASGNLIRVMSEVEGVRDSLESEEPRQVQFKAEWFIFSRHTFKFCFARR